MKTEPLFRRAPLITRGLKGKFYIPEEGKDPLTFEQVIIRMQNYNHDLITDLNAYYEATRGPVKWLTRCAYCDGIIDPNAHNTLKIRLNGRECYICEAAIEDAYWDENFPPGGDDLHEKTLPGGMVLRDDTLETFHHKIRQLWCGDRENWTMEAEHMKKTALRRVVLELGWKPGVPLLQQAPEWIAATPRRLYTT